MDGAAGKMSKKRDGQERKTYQSYPSVPGRYTVPRGSHFSAFPVIIMWRNDTTEHDNNIQHCLQNTDHSATCMCVCVGACVGESVCSARVSRRWSYRAPRWRRPVVRPPRGRRTARPGACCRLLTLVCHANSSTLRWSPR